MIRSHIYANWRDTLPAKLEVGVSLHSHTSRSKETMTFIPRYVSKVPYLSGRIRRLEKAYIQHHGREFDYGQVWWNPPLEPKAAFDLERKQIESKLQRPALVSLTDHDDIEAGLALQLFEDSVGMPVSTEWTVHLGPSFLHIGVHNIQPARARMLMEAMARVTAEPDKYSAEEMLDELARDPATLIILNHPLWDENRIGEALHREILMNFLRRCGQYIHALELNGLRHWKENHEVTKLAAEFNLPVISGGDRHGCEPNALVNLTNARTFSEFAAEVRSGAPTHTVYLDQYREPWSVRVVEVMSDVLKDYDEFSEDRRRWSDRVFYQTADGTVKPLSDVWTGNGPSVIGQYVSLMQLLRFRGIRKCLRLALGEAQPMVPEQ
ncbi:MAG: hypothetical protein OHK0021_18620 [Bryobacter sp.]